MNRPTVLSLAVALLASCACGPKASQVDSASGGGDGGTPDVPPDLPPACEPPLVDCDGQCVDLQNDIDNCGRCGFGCWIITPGIDVPNVRGTCSDGWCSPRIGDFCVEPISQKTCAELCESSNGRCVAGGCFDATIVWSANYQECLADLDDCIVPEFTGCSGEPVDLVTYQNVSCDTPIDEAFAQTGLPPKPPEQTEGPYAGWIPESWAATCCCEPYHFD